MTSSWNCCLIVWVFHVSGVAYFHTFPAYKKLKLSPYINKLQAFKTLVKGGSEWSATAPGQIYLWGKNLHYPLGSQAQYGFFGGKSFNCAENQTPVPLSSSL